MDATSWHARVREVLALIRCEARPSSGLRMKSEALAMLSAQLLKSLRDFSEICLPPHYALDVGMAIDDAHALHEICTFARDSKSIESRMDGDFYLSISKLCSSIENWIGTEVVAPERARGIYANGDLEILRRDEQIYRLASEGWNYQEISEWTFEQAVEQQWEGISARQVGNRLNEYCNYFGKDKPPRQNGRPRKNSRKKQQ